MRSSPSMLLGLFSLCLLIGLFSLGRQPGFESAEALAARVTSARPATPLAFALSGRLDTLYVQEGDNVQTGQLLAELAAHDITRRLTELEHAITIETHRLARFSAQRNYPNLPPVLTPSEAATYTLWQRHIAALEAELAITQAALPVETHKAQTLLGHQEAQLAILETQTQRHADLAARGLLPQGLREEIELTYLASQSAVSRQSFDLEAVPLRTALQQSALERQISLLHLQSSADYDQSLQRLTLLQNEAAQLRSEQNSHALYAPTNGTVLALHAGIGQILPAGSSVILLEGASEPLMLQAQIPAMLRPQLSLGDRLRLAPLFAQDNRRLSAEIVSLSPDTSGDTGSFLALLTFPEGLDAPRGTAIQLLMPLSSQNALSGLLSPILASLKAPIAEPMQSH